MIEYNDRYYEDENMFHGFIPYIMGTRFDILIISPNKIQINNTWKKIVSELEQLDIMMNRFSQYSEVAFINSHASINPVHTSNEMNTILQICKYYYEKTLHLFDVTLKNFEDIKWHDNQNISFKRRHISLDFGGFAKGYALKKIKDILSEEKIQQAFVDFGNSSIMGIGHHPYGDYWKVGLVNPYTQLTLDEYNLKDTTLSTSGNTPQNPKHIVNPLTGIYEEKKGMSTIVSDNPLDAEILSTVWIIANPDQKKKITLNFKSIKTSIYYL